MKKILNIALLLAMGALAMSCTKENNPNEEESGVYTFTATAVDIAGADATKTYLGTDGLTALWTGNEVLHLAYEQNGEAKTVDAVLDQACKGTTDAVFTLKAEDATALVGVETVYPYIAAEYEGNLNYPLIRLAIIDGEICIGTSYKPTDQGDEKYDQNPTSTSYDPNKDVLVGKPIQVADLKSDKPVALQLSRPVALLKVVPQFDDAAKKLLGNAKITTAQVNTSGQEIYFQQRHILGYIMVIHLMMINFLVLLMCNLLQV